MLFLVDSSKSPRKGSRRSRRIHQPINATPGALAIWSTSCSRLRLWTVANEASERWNTGARASTLGQIVDDGLESERLTLLDKNCCFLLLESVDSIIIVV